ncbi:MAG TPA: YbaK/EbsC family protein [Candidatus Saccharimonadales bacterium]|nr:YbaK/EbsC family protein [Candidatus Saccharimonadales bacterium]
MRYGTLTFEEALDKPELLAGPTLDYLKAYQLRDVWVSGIDPSLADTAAFCDAYEVSLGVSANCVVVEAKRGERAWYAACVVLATNRIDVNGAVRKLLEARKVSFAPMDSAIKLTGMEYGGITPIGLPPEWPIFIDDHAMKQEKLILGSGIRGSKILTTAKVLGELSGAQVVAIVKN